MRLVCFDVAIQEKLIIRKIAKRWRQELPVFRSYSTLHMAMDLTATHANGCPLRLEELLNAPPEHFAHDVCGIYRFLNRTTGCLYSCFSPRYAKPG